MPLLLFLFLLSHCDRCCCCCCLAKTEKKNKTFLSESLILLSCHLEFTIEKNNRKKKKKKAKIHNERNSNKTSSTLKNGKKLSARVLQQASAFLSCNFSTGKNGNVSDGKTTKRHFLCCEAWLGREDSLELETEVLRKCQVSLVNLENFLSLKDNFLRKKKFWSWKSKILIFLFQNNLKKWFFLKIVRKLYPILRISWA